MSVYVVVINPYGEVSNLTSYGPVFAVVAKSQKEAKSKVKKIAGPRVSTDALDAYRAETIQ